MRVLPRYVFMSGEMCPHGLPDCLCDVIVDRPVKIATDVEHLFHQLALDELDDYKVSAKNVVEFFSIVLGSWSAWVDEGLDLPTDDLLHDGTQDTVFGPAEFRVLSVGERNLFRAHYRVGSPWTVAQHVLPLTVTPQGFAVLRRFYGQQKCNSGRAATRRVSASVVECVVCGVGVLNAGGQRKTCSPKCRTEMYREKKRAIAETV